MNKLIWIESASKKSVNDLGEAPPTYSLLGEFYAAVDYMAGTEGEKDGVRVASQRAKFTVKSLNQFLTTDRIAFGGKYWDVEKTYPLRNDYQVLEAVTRNPLDGIPEKPEEE